MLLSSILPCALALISANTVLALPAKQNSTSDGNTDLNNSLQVYMTTDPFWGNRETTGLFKLVEVDFGACVGSLDSDWDRQISSFGPDEGLKCIIYDDTDCHGAFLPVWHPGYADMTWDGWDNRIRSWMCDEGGCDTLHGICSGQT